MPRRPAKLIIERMNLPDLEAAAEAILPLFLAFLDQRAAKLPTVPGPPATPVAPAGGKLK